MSKRFVKKYNKFILKEGKREQEKIDELLLIMKKRKLTTEEHELLVMLSKGGSLPEEEKPILQTHKTGGGYLFDEEGDVLTSEVEPEKPGKKMITAKGKQRSADKIGVKDILEARVYRNKASEERFIYILPKEDDPGTEYNWIVYRTGGGLQYGQFCDINSQKYSFYKNMSPTQLWKELDYSMDYGMIFDHDLYRDFTNFMNLYKEDQKRYAQVLTQIRNSLLKLL